MLIAVDQGNTRIKVGIFLGDSPPIVLTIPDQMDLLQEWLEQSTDDDILIVSDVSGQFSDTVFRSFQGQTMTLTKDLKLPFKLNYDTPETLGVDRLALAAGAQSLFQDNNVMVIDAGSCITMDLVTKDGQYQGGIITPGVQMRMRAMSEFTGKLPAIEPAPSMLNIGKTTVDCMLIGGVNGAIKEVESTITSWQSEYTDLKVVVCGGDGQYLVNASKSDIFAEPNLVLYGLEAIALFQ